MLNALKTTRALRGTRQLRLEDLAKVTAVESYRTPNKSVITLSSPTNLDKQQDENTDPVSVEQNIERKHGGSRNKTCYDDKRIVLETDLMG